MDNDKKKLVKSTIKKTVKIIVEPEFVGDKTISEVFLPIIFDEIIKQLSDHTFDNCS